MAHLGYCTLCKEHLQTDDYENPGADGAIYARNPETFREGWMHGSCYLVAIEEAKDIPSKKPEFGSRFDELMSLEQDG